MVPGTAEQVARRLDGAGLRCAHLVGLDRWARRRGRALVGLFVLVVLLRLATLPFFPPPVPKVHDEFSYLLGADLLASGHAGRPAHPLWEFFDTIHVIARPVYASKYPPGQALFLAVGQSLFGHPYAGVVISSALATAAVFWMLLAVAPPGIALLGGLHVALVFSSLHYWMQSYWGGSVALSGAALVIGAALRMLRWSDGRAGWMLGLGAALLMVSRPYEGAVLVLMVSAALMPRLWSHPQVRLAFLRSATLLLPALLALGWYNYQVTGSPYVLPYSLYDRTYAAVPPLWPLPAYQPKEHSNAALAQQHAVLEYGDYAKARYGNKLSLLTRRSAELIRSAALWCGLFLFALLCAPVRKDYLVRLLVIVSLGALVALFLEVFFFQHYMAPLLAVWIALGYRSLWIIRHRRKAFTLVLMTSLLWSAGLALRKLQQEVQVLSQSKMARDFPFNRHLLETQLKGMGGGHVVLVRYAPGHSSRYEWVYNAGLIDSAPVIWAHDRGIDNARLLNRYPNRAVWIIEPDSSTPTARLLWAASVSR